MAFIISLFLIGSIPGLLFPSTKTENTQQGKNLEATKAKPAKQAPQVLKELSTLLDSANQEMGFQLYSGVKIEEHGAQWAVITVSDDWYNLENYVKERLVMVLVGYYKDVEGGLNHFAEVSLKDQFGKELATGYYSSAGIQTEVK